MPFHTSRTASHDDNESFDLSDIFIGREQQLDFFGLYLNRWKKRIFDAIADETLVTTAPSPNNKIQGMLVLLYGRGGFGKSTLLRRYREIALEENQNPLSSKLTVSDVVDWEFAVESSRGLFTLPQGEEVNASEYFKLLCRQLAVALDKNLLEFQEYQLAVKAIERARKEAIGVLDSLRRDDRQSSTTSAAVGGLMTTLSLVTAPPISKILSNDKVIGMTSEGIKITGELLKQVKQKLHDKLGDRLSDFLDPSFRLGLALGRDLSKFDRNFPLLIFFDTYEEIDEGDPLLRIVMGAAGLRVGWVLAGRDNLWAGSDQSERSIDLVYGYKDLIPSDRGLPVDFNVGGIGAFTVNDIKVYFDVLCKQVKYTPPLPSITEEGAKRILNVTKGVPLAVKIAAGLYTDTADLNTITEEVKGKRKIVDQMVRRYLLHARDDQSERAKLYGLAMLRRPDQPSAVAAALGLSPEQMVTSYASELSRLHRRYSFIFTEKEEPSLHQEVRFFLRSWLLERYQQPAIVAVNERLKEAHEAALKMLEDQWKYSSLKARFENEEWIEQYLDLTEQQFWLNPAQGVAYALPLMLTASIYLPYLISTVVQLGDFFAAVLTQPHRNWWTWARQSLGSTAYPSWPMSHPFLSPLESDDKWERAIHPQSFGDPIPSEQEKLQGLERLEPLVSQYGIGFPQPLPDYQDELKAALYRLLAKHYSFRDNTKALEWYEKALTLLGQDVELRKAVARTYISVSYALHNEKKYAERIPLLNRAIELAPTYATAYNDRGVAHDWLKEYEQARKEYARAIELDPTDAIVYNNRGGAYIDLKEYKQAIKDFDRAIELAPTDALAYYGRGRTYADSKEYERAIEDCHQAIKLDPSDARAFLERGYTYIFLKEFKQALQDFGRAIELDPSDARAFSDRGYTYIFLKEFKQALQDFGRAIELNPSYASAYPGRGLPIFTSRNTS